MLKGRNGGDRMALEIERKYLIRRPAEDWLRSRPGAAAAALEQCYLTARPGWERRIRRAACLLTGTVRCTLTEKTETAGLVRTELEREITPAEYEALLAQALPGLPVLRKVRWAFPYAGRTVEIDLYPFWSEKAILEVELPSPQEVPLLPPEIIVLREVTDDPGLKNRALALEQAWLQQGRR